MINRISTLLLAAFSAAAQPICASEPPPHPTCAFALDAWRFCPPQENWIFSPASASACLSMALAGASGTTQSELSKALHSDGSETSWIANLSHRPSHSGDYEMRLAQGVWIRKDSPILPDFESRLKTDFLARIESADFSPSTVEEINAWVSDCTKQKIRSLLSPSDLDPSSRLVLANALYFKGGWDCEFPAANTRNAQFFPSDSQPRLCSMMSQTNIFPYYENDLLQAVLLPIRKAPASPVSPACLMILPKGTSLELTPSLLEETLQSMSHRNIRLEIPRFTVELQCDLKNLLEKQGCSAPFSMSADFSGIDGSSDLYIGKAIQKTFFSFEEGGIEAAAASAAIICCKSAAISDQQTIEFIANRPFQFLLLDRNSQACLFAGSIRNPSE